VGRFLAMRDVFGMLGDLMGGGSGLLGRLPGMKQLRQLGAMRKLAQNPEALQGLLGGGPGMPALAGGGGLPGGFTAPVRSTADRAKQKDKRKKEKEARKKTRKR
jgi:signal recognition particle subunit SRP54